jgi:hypothetical protein
MKLIVDIKDGYEPVFLRSEGEIAMTVEAPFILIEKEGTGKPNEEKVIFVRVGDTRPCSHCKKERTVEEYYPTTKTTTGYQNTCITCMKESGGKPYDKDE